MVCNIHIPTQCCTETEGMPIPPLIFNILILTDAMISQILLNILVIFKPHLLIIRSFFLATATDRNVQELLCHLKCRKANICKSISPIPYLYMIFDGFIYIILLLYLKLFPSGKEIQQTQESLATRDLTMQY